MEGSGPKHISFFDLDHTLLNDNCSFRFGKFLYQQKLLSLKSTLSLLLIYFFHKLGFLSIYQVHEKSFKILFSGKSKKHYAKLAESFVSLEFEHLINSEICSLMRNLQSSGHHTVILSSSPTFLVEEFAKLMYVNDVFGTNYQTCERGKLYSGIELVLEADEKAIKVKTFAQKLSVPLSSTYGYSDSHLDIPFLQAVGHPCAVNPTKKLRKYSIDQNWNIIDTSSNF
ncbi:MAG: HAD-IB family hydrolase [Chlamydiota bacterium]|nr:HAD-IB family hydrolase [Chlamydiota bacterium]